MFNSSPTREPLTDGAVLSPSSSIEDKSSMPLPLPVLSRKSSRASSVSSYKSNSPLQTSTGSPRPKSLGQRVRSWVTPRGDHSPGSQPHPKGGGSAKAPAPRLRAWHGWRVILFDSWLNVLLLLVPLTYILKLSNSEHENIIFGACVLSMIPLVKLHDLATSVLAARIGGSKTGLLNASMSNIVELVVAVTALRKCELRVVQSSLIGAMLAKMLLVLGMCFFAGGLRFSEQGFDSTATQIHSSLLSISVGAVLLPAAFHFALSYSSSADIVGAGASLETQKRDILRMSHGVAIVLLFIYISYLLFQLWSHTHLFQDSQTPSKQLPAAVSVREVTSRVREKGNLFMKSNPSLVSLKTFGTPKPGKRSAKPNSQPPSPLVEMPETSTGELDPFGRSGGPYMKRTSNRSGLLISPFATTSQLTLPGNGSGAIDSSVRLVPDNERYALRREGSDLSVFSSGYSSEEEQNARNGGSGLGLHSRSQTLVNDVPNAYFPDSPEEKVDHAHFTDVDLSDEKPRPTHKRVTSERIPPEQQLSWTLTIVLLIFVTVLVAVNAEWMVDSMDRVSTSVSKEWIGLILLPAVSSIAECVTAINVSVKDQLTLSISVAVGSTIQTALFVVPFMVTLGWIMDKPLALLFDPFESVVLYISVHTMGYVVADGKSNWLEGVILICLYIIIAVSFWFYPGSNFSTNLAVCAASTTAL